MVRIIQPTTQTGYYDTSSFYFIHTEHLPGILGMLHGEELDLKPSQANPEEKALGVELRPAAQPYLPGKEQRQNDNGQDKQGLHVSSAGTSGGAADSSSTSAFRSRARLASSSMVIWLPSWD